MRLLLTLFLVSISFVCVAASSGTSAPPDSIGVERKGKKNVVLYKIEAGETLFGITRKYRTTVADVQRLNPGLAKGGLKVGQVLKVPALSDHTTPTTVTKAPEGSVVEKMHIVASGQTLFAIARQYKVSVANLMAWNNLASAGLVEGQQLRVSAPHDEPAAGSPPIAQTEKPAPKPEHKPEPKPEPKKEQKAEAKPEPKAETSEPKPEPAPKHTSEPKEGYVRHTVKTGETLYAIARTYNTKVDQIKADNTIGDQDVRVGQVLEIKKGAPMDEQTVAATPAAPVAQRVAEARGEETDSAAAKNALPTVAGYERVVEHGIAELVDNDAGSRNYFCLHRTAPIGKILQVVNEMNGAKVFVRVIGKLPETGNNDKIAIKISKKAFEALAAPDKRFPVEISYPNSN